MTTGDRIKRLRKERGLSAEDLGAMIGKDRSTIYRYERGDIENATIDVVPHLANALQTTPQHQPAKEQEGREGQTHSP